MRGIRIAASCVLPDCRQLLRQSAIDEPWNQRIQAREQFFRPTDHCFGAVARKHVEQTRGDALRRIHRNAELLVQRLYGA